LTKQFTANVIFTPYACLLRGPTIQTVSLSNQVRGLYFLQQGCQFKKTDEDTHSSSIHLQRQTEDFGVACFSNTRLWHFRLGHLSFEQLKYIHAVVCNNDRSPGICQIFHLAKMHRLGFLLSNSKVKHCFDLLHVDIRGPYPHNTC